MRDFTQSAPTRKFELRNRAPERPADWPPARRPPANRRPRIKGGIGGTHPSTRAGSAPWTFASLICCARGGADTPELQGLLGDARRYFARYGVEPPLTGAQLRELIEAAERGQDLWRLRGGRAA